ncbi:hypothetical protein C8R45DRAFT_1090827 [Mycena sanguinolenta]|nr:hypothetical protein C8R45DRAFT_1090827 [Mycena sanguinolenta]
MRLNARCCLSATAFAFPLNLGLSPQNTPLAIQCALSLKSSRCQVIMRGDGKTRRRATPVIASPTPVSATTTPLEYVPSTSPPATIINSQTAPSSSGFVFLTSESSQLLHLCSVQILLPLFSSYPLSPPSALRPPSFTRKLTYFTPPYETPLPPPFPPHSPLALACSLLRSLPPSSPRRITSIIPTHFLFANFSTRLERVRFKLGSGAVNAIER